MSEVYHIAIIAHDAGRVKAARRGALVKSRKECYNDNIESGRV
jgi:hypothetical protein